MWLFTKHGFFSVVRESTQPMADVVIRARDDKHLDKLLNHVGRPGLTSSIIHTTSSDYPYRVVVPVHVWKDISDTLAYDIDYTNFKAKVGRRNQRYSDVLHAVWALVRSHYRSKRSMVHQQRKEKRTITWQHFDQDGKLLRETTTVQNVWWLKNGGMRINFLGGQRPVYEVGGRLLAFGGQRAPIRRAAPWPPSNQDTTQVSADMPI